MKKVLFGTTALVAAGLVAGQASAAEPISLSVSGYMQQHVGFATQEDRFSNTATGTGSADKTAVGTSQDTEVFFKGKTTLDNGISVAVNIQLEAQADAGTTRIDESFLTISSPTLGSLILGSEDNAHYLVHQTAPDVGISHTDGDVGNWIAPGNTAITDHTGIEGGGDASKIQYVSPSFGGFGFAAGYTPDASSDAAKGGYSTSADFAEQYFAGVFFDGEIAQGVGIHLDAGIAETMSNTTNNEITDVSVGASLKTGGFTLGAGYINRDTDKNAATSVDGFTAAAGIAYETGPYGISLSGIIGENEGATATTANDEFSSVMLSGSYALGPGVTLVASGIYATYDDETTVASSSNEGFAFVTGFNLSF